MDYLAYLITGIAAGLLAGLLGVGGGIVVVPALSYLFHAQDFSPELIMHRAVGTSFAIMIFSTAAAAFAFQRRKLIIWPLFYKFVPGLIVGTAAASYFTQYLSDTNLRLAFAVFLFFMALYMFFSKEIKGNKPLPSFLILSIISILIGLLAGFFGIGGGSMMVPFFCYCQIEMHKSTATSVLCALPLAIVGTLGMSLSGWDAANIHHGLTGYVYWPAALIVALSSLCFAPLGAKLASKISSRHLKRIFSIFLMVVAMDLFWS